MFGVACQVHTSIGVYMCRLSIPPFSPRQVYHAYTQVQVATLRGHSSAVATLAWSPGDHTLLSVGVNGAVYFWCARSWQRLADLEHVDKRCIYTGGVFYAVAAAHQGQGEASGEGGGMLTEGSILGLYVLPVGSAMSFSLLPIGLCVQGRLCLQTDSIYVCICPSTITYMLLPPFLCLHRC